MTDSNAHMITRRNTVKWKRQAGYATLGIGIVLLSILSLMTIYLSKSGILDLRTSADKARHAEALAMAERRLDVGVGWLSNSGNRETFITGGANDVNNDATWPTCDTLAAPFSTLGTQWRCLSLSSTYDIGGGATQTDAFVLATPATVATGRGLNYFVLGTGESADLTASAVVKEGFHLHNVFEPGHGFPPPMVGVGNIPLNGTFSVVANPNGGGPGVPVSVWSHTDISAPSGSSATCQLYEFNRDGDCTGGAISSAAIGKGPDIVDNDPYPNFPSDLFAFTFGVSPGDVKAQATVVNDCTGLAGLSGIVWVMGSCTISGTVGSAAHPLIVVVESGDITMNANSAFYGLMFAYGPNGNAGDITANGGATFHGSMLSNDTVSMGININGTFNMLWDGTVQGALETPGGGYTIMILIPGSWADYL